MTVNRTKKNRKLRGSKSHGWGAKKKHRGSGNKGGRGMAGTGKRADQKKSFILKFIGNDYFGKKGFHSRKKVGLSLNIKDLEKNIDKLTTKEGNVHIFDVKKKGYKRLLSMGEVKNKFKIIGSCSAKAKEKIEAAGGEVLDG